MENNPGYRQFHIFDSAEATTKLFENKSNQGCMSELVQLLDEMMLHVNLLSHINELVNLKEICQ
jgi:hypothetical protein